MPPLADNILLCIFLGDKKTLKKVAENKLQGDKLVRASIGDYVHIGVLQSIILTILSLSPDSPKVLYQSGQLMGKFFSQRKFLMDNPNLLKLPHLDERQRLRIVLKALEKHFSIENKFICYKSKATIRSKKKAIFRIYDLAFSAGLNGRIGKPVCYFAAGEIAGLLETTLGEKISVKETKCHGLGNSFCEFSIEVGKRSELEAITSSTSAEFSEKNKARLRSAMCKISQSMYSSALIRSVTRQCGDYVHLSVLQHSLCGIKFSDPFYATLLYYSGFYVGRYGEDFQVVERVATRTKVSLPCEFEEGIPLLVHYFNDPSTILTRMQGNVEFEVIDDEEAVIRVHECATASGLELQSEQHRISQISEESKIFLCDYTSGFIAGRLSKIIDSEVIVKEIKCHSQGDTFCEFSVMLE